MRQILDAHNQTDGTKVSYRITIVTEQLTDGSWVFSVIVRPFGGKATKIECADSEAAWKLFEILSSTEIIDVYNY